MKILCIISACRSSQIAKVCPSIHLLSQPAWIEDACPTSLRAWRSLQPIQQLQKYLHEAHEMHGFARISPWLKNEYHEIFPTFSQHLESIKSRKLPRLGRSRPSPILLFSAYCNIVTWYFPVFQFLFIFQSSLEFP